MISLTYVEPKKEGKSRMVGKWGRVGQRVHDCNYKMNKFWELMYMETSDNSTIFFTCNLIRADS